jgi:hypothetical protein
MIATLVPNVGWIHVNSFCSLNLPTKKSFIKQKQNAPSKIGQLLEVERMLQIRSDQTLKMAKVFGHLGPTSLLLHVSAWRDRYAALRGHSSKHTYQHPRL